MSEQLKPDEFCLSAKEAKRLFEASELNGQFQTVDQMIRQRELCAFQEGYNQAWNTRTETPTAYAMVAEGVKNIPTLDIELAFAVHPKVGLGVVNAVLDALTVVCKEKKELTP